MPSESDQKIEELLKAYAKKRRDEAGAPFELTPPTRRMLQAEVTRQWSKSAERASVSFFQLLARFWPQITLAVSGVLLVGVIVRMLTGTERSPMQVAFQQGPAPANSASESAKTAPLKAESLSDSAALKSQDGARAKASAEAKKLDADSYGEFGNAVGNARSYAFSQGLMTNTVPAPNEKLAAQAGVAGNAAPANDTFGRDTQLAANAPAQQSAGRSRAFFKEQALAESEKMLRLSDAPASVNSDSKALAYSLESDKQNLQQKSGLTLNAPAAPATPAAEPPTLAKRIESIPRVEPPAGNVANKPAGAVADQLGRSDAADLSGAERVRFSQITAVTEARGGQASAGLPPLSSFDVEQKGERIRIYDSDGSVYEGQIATDAESATRLAGEPSVVEKAKRELKDLTDERIQPAQKSVQLNEELVGQDRYFQATGTNRSLNRAVVINGTLISGTIPEAKTKLGATLLRQAPQATPTTGPAPMLAPATPTPARGLAGARASTASATRRALQEQPPLATEQLLRVRGRARIGGTNELEINAVRAPRAANP